MNHLPESKIDLLIKQIVEIESSPQLFNPYRDTCPIHDAAHAPEIRRQNLSRYLRAQLNNAPKDMWIAEAGGYNGLRRSGVPLVPESDFQTFPHFLAKPVVFCKATKTAAMNIKTAKYIRDEIERIGRLPLLWNSVLVHPHRVGKPLSNRKPTRQELRSYTPIIELLIEIFEFQRIIAIGRTAEEACLSKGVKCHYVRHPSMGGAAAFREGIRKIYGD